MRAEGIWYWVNGVVCGMRDAVLCLGMGWFSVFNSCSGPRRERQGQPRFGAMDRNIGSPHELVLFVPSLTPPGSELFISSHRGVGTTLPGASHIVNPIARRTSLQENCNTAVLSRRHRVLS